ncbi:hypothetical protein KOI35_17205 [Actinoplanes bogorensis]|uniref:DUF4878 domain-containing protein n=1 Tax=Paractinoplanes bogorensis TaxID=1610840 RepID=A0ABS5YP64_9ACTN|nr:hypothetical protein [Actinoplanes bogorensis]MBU2665244.1 hypothetical protein [Actinoplanes bogorensis]
MTLPAMSPVSGPPPRRGSVLTPVGASVAVVAALALAAVCALPAFGFFVYWFLGPDIDEAQAAAVTYVEQIEKGDKLSAYAMVCTESRTELTAGAFGELVDAAPQPVSHRVTNRFFTDEAGSSARVDIDLTDSAGATRRLDLSLTSENGKWQVCGDPLV